MKAAQRNVWLTMADETTPWDRHHAAVLAAKGLDQPFPPETGAQFANLYERLMGGWDSVHDRELSVTEFWDMAKEHDDPRRAPIELLDYAVLHGWRYLDACRMLVEYGYDEDVIVSALHWNQRNSFFSANWRTIDHWVPFQEWLEANNDEGGVSYPRLKSWWSRAYGYQTTQRVAQRLVRLFGYELLDTRGRPYRFGTRRKVKQ